MAGCVTVSARCRHVAGGILVANDSIPLYDGDLSGAEIIHENGDAPASPDVDGRPAQSDDVGNNRRVRCRRRNARRPCERVHVCFSPSAPSGRVEHVECPVRDISKTGFAVEFDRPLATGVSGYISYYTISHQPVRVSCSVRHCHPLGEGRYFLGLTLNRDLSLEEQRPSKTGPGRSVSPCFRPRPLHRADVDSNEPQRGSSDDNPNSASLNAHVDPGDGV